ncbi:hypothetical protein FH972_022858 [Carpinus fangiana]|uniref:RNA helicase n=1 Tax=Carpinus fangiana TaxID=176857 RepID=A0A5N6KTS6_9ROSI|nr:hypothetical protein FH972_022858 [Carpinus fangiana]
MDSDSVSSGSSRHYSEDSDASETSVGGGPRKRRRLSVDLSLNSTRLAAPSRVQNQPHRPASKTILEVNDLQKNTFAQIGVHRWLTSALAALAIKRPTSIQAACIPEILQGRDCIGGSRTGSGKTMAFAVPILQQWAVDPVGIYAVVLTPTRELALQIFEQFKAIGSSQSLKPILVTGGEDQRAQAISLAQRPHVVIATPGRLADHIRTSGKDTVGGLRKAHFVVLDEADRLLATGPGSMLPDVETCLSALPPSSERQTCLFTATVTPEVRALKEMPRPKNRPPVFVCEVDTDVLAIPPSLHQSYLQTPVMQRESYLHVLLLTPANLQKSVIIFCNRTDTATLLEHMLRMLDHRVTALHSKLAQPQRIANLGRFRARATRILVATDVAARGLDIPEVALVVNYDVPRDPDDYIHRVGRTARAGRRGHSVTMVGQRDVDLVLAIEKRVGKKMEGFSEEGVNVETRVVRDALKVVGEKKREAMLQIEEGREVTGKRKKGYEETVEDYFSASLGTIFPDETRNMHGDQDAMVVYKSPSLGELKLSLAEPSGQELRQLFAHYLWNAGVWVAAKIEDASLGTDEEADRGLWNVRDESVLELGAGLGLAGIVSCLVGASKTIVSDYPAVELVQNLEQNVKRNIKPERREYISVAGHEWGTFPAKSESKILKESFTKIFSADCLWMPWQHQNLAKSMAYYLAREPQARVFVVAGFHTGRAKMVPFFEVVEEEGLEVEEIYEEDVHGTKREWAKVRDGGREDITGRKRWLAIAVLKRKT